MDCLEYTTKDGKMNVSKVKVETSSFLKIKTDTCSLLVDPREPLCCNSDHVKLFQTTFKTLYYFPWNRVFVATTATTATASSKASVNTSVSVAATASTTAVAAVAPAAKRRRK